MAKRRIKLEAKEHYAHVWITDGYTIENYIKPEVLKAALVKVHPLVGQHYDVQGDKFTPPLGKPLKGGKTKLLKVRITQAVVEISDQVPDGARGPMKAIASKILDANGMRRT